MEPRSLLNFPCCQRWTETKGSSRTEHTGYQSDTRNQMFVMEQLKWERNWCLFFSCKKKKKSSRCAQIWNMNKEPKEAKKKKHSLWDTVMWRVMRQQEIQSKPNHKSTWIKICMSLSLILEVTFSGITGRLWSLSHAWFPLYHCSGALFQTSVWIELLLSSPEDRPICLS